MKESLKALEEAKAIQLKKSNDYQNAESRIKQAQYYPHGCATILDLIHSKVLRMYSVMEAMENDKNYKPNFESLEDSAIDLINYGSFFVSFMRGKMEGQDPSRDFLNRKITKVDTQDLIESCNADCMYDVKSDALKSTYTISVNVNDNPMEIRDANNWPWR